MTLCAVQSFVPTMEGKLTKSGVAGDVHDMHCS